MSRTRSAYAAIPYLHVSERIVVFSRAERVELVSGAEQSLHHERVCRGIADIVLSQELQQVLVVVPYTHNMDK